MVPWPSSDSRPEDCIARTVVSTRGTCSISFAKSGRLYSLLTVVGLCLLATGLAHSALIWCSKKIGRGKIFIFEDGKYSPEPLEMFFGSVSQSWGVTSCRGSFKSKADKLLQSRY